MPSSRPNTIPTVIHLLKQLDPQSILDIGVGFGKWGHLFREYTDIQAAEAEPDRYRRENWKIRIDGIEGYPGYLTEMHRYLYNDLHTGEALSVLRGLAEYDLVFLGDIIEHFEKEAGWQLLREAVAHARKAVIVSTPKYDTAQPDLCGNELERHRSVWKEKDFRQFEGAVVKTIDRATLLVAIVKAGVPVPALTPPFPPRAADLKRLQKAVDALRNFIPLEQSFILVDEEQVRSGLPHRRAIPFLEKDGEYWGAPEDDGTAIADFERLREGGAGFIAFIWPCFWWLDHYAAFNTHLRQRFPCVVQNKFVIIFDLRHGIGQESNP
jgi:hypothetical protein